MNEIGRNDVVQVIMRHASFATFLQMRLVCKRWEAWSRSCVQHWYDWLCAYGPRDPWILRDHNWLHCDYGGEGKCRVRHHYLSAYHPPKLLVTVALCDQVFSYGCRKMLSRIERNYQHYYERMAELEMQRKQAELMYIKFAKWREQAQLAAAKHAQRVASRKRRRISKPGD